MRNHAFTIIEFLIVIVIVGVLVFLLQPALSHPSGKAIRMGCVHNMRQIGEALLQYHEEHGTFPPAYSVDKEGIPYNANKLVFFRF